MISNSLKAYLSCIIQKRGYWEHSDLKITLVPSPLVAGKLRFESTRYHDLSVWIWVKASDFTEVTERPG